TRWDGKGVASPVTLVATAFGTVTDVRRAVTPELRGGTLLLVDLGGGKARLGGSVLAQCFGQLGDEAPDLDDPARLRAFFETTQQLAAAGVLTAYHDVSDGGPVIAALEMAFASGASLELDFSGAHEDKFRALFAEELAAVVEVAPENIVRVREAFEAAGARVIELGRARVELGG